MMCACKMCYNDLFSICHFSDRELRHITIVLHVYAEKSTFKLSRFVVGRNNVRHSWFAGESKQLTETGMLNLQPHCKYLLPVAFCISQLSANMPFVLLLVFNLYPHASEVAKRFCSYASVFVCVCLHITTKRTADQNMM